MVFSPFSLTHTLSIHTKTHTHIYNNNNETLCTRLAPELTSLEPWKERAGTTVTMTLCRRGLSPQYHECKDACAPRFPARNDVKLAENRRPPPHRATLWLLSSSAGCILPQLGVNARGPPTLLYTY